MKKILLIAISILLISPVYAEKVKKKVKLPAESIVTIKTLEEMSSQKQVTPRCEVNADVWDENGEVVLIRKGTPADVQLIVKKASLIGDGGCVQFQPISTTAFNGRLIGFDQQTVSFYGADDALLRSRKKVKVMAGTSFRAYTANDLYFTVEVEEVVEE